MPARWRRRAADWWQMRAWYRQRGQLAAIRIESFRNISCVISPIDVHVSTPVSLTDVGVDSNGFLFPTWLRRTIWWCYVWAVDKYAHEAAGVIDTNSSRVPPDCWKKTWRINIGYNTVWSEFIMSVYTSKLTPDSVVTYLFHDCERSHCDCSASYGLCVRSKYSQRS